MYICKVVPLSNKIMIPFGSRFIFVFKRKEEYLAIIEEPKKIIKHVLYKVIMCFGKDVHIGHNPTYFVGSTFDYGENLRFFAEEIPNVNQK